LQLYQLPSLIVATTGKGKLKNVPKKKVVSEALPSKPIVEQLEILVNEVDIDKSVVSISEDDEDSDPAETCFLLLFGTLPLIEAPEFPFCNL
jgi:hypothetical protein